jgi:diacylglycerol kinase
MLLVPLPVWRWESSVCAISREFRRRCTETPPLPHRDRRPLSIRFRHRLLMADPCASKNRHFLARLRCAASGIRLVHRREKSFRAQLRLALAAAMATAALGAGPVWAAMLFLAIGLVLALEAVNSALEYLIDHLHPALADEIGRAKDAAAGAVLIASLAAFGVAAAMVWDGLVTVT